MYRYQVYFFMFVLLTGCAATSGVHPDSLMKPVKVTEFTLNESVAEIMTVTNLFGTKSEMLSGLVKGRYVSRYEDEKGVFYEGPSNCLVQNNSSGGIYLPKKNTNEKPAFWLYIRGMSDADRARAGLVVAIGDSWEEGRVKKDWWTTVSGKLLNLIKVKAMPAGDKK